MKFSVSVTKCENIRWKENFSSQKQGKYVEKYVDLVSKTLIPF